MTGSDTALRSTELGTDMFERGAAVQRDLQAERMQGITEAEFATAITVLQRTTTNVAGTAWRW